ncbi:MAG: aspartate aminotransferase family protein [Candidatus Sericytochromatia bacterium]|uniref:Aspartate aminotransferase family protein n=1 Tax=Candidatus Tanganyikabacteria bacterium TaxID=2961651 RepID=A0A938BKG8_9BACT|nr:aspartate aminotransferase family protein [Candidatus Tanganyikabacteria bacterium]
MSPAQTPSEISISAAARIPEEGLAATDVLAALEDCRQHDADWRNARTWSLVYHAEDSILDLVKEAHSRYFCENALNPLAFPSLKRLENEVVQMTAQMLNAPDTAAGTMTSGGSESLLMAFKTAREWARAHHPAIHEPEVLLPVTAHPAMLKAAHYFGLRAVHVPVDAGFRASAGAAANLITDRTILVIASAPAYPHGVIDPVSDLAALASQHGILCHVDACLGGFLLPWVEKLGRPLPPFDFRVPGVTSMSADIHKYGFAAKGASVVLYRTRELRRHQFFTYPDWPGGLYGSPSMAGTRPGGAIAAAWSVMCHLGEAGYLRLARVTLETTEALIAGVRAIPGLYILGEPDMSVFAFAADDLDVYLLADAMEVRGWKLDRQQRPPSLHVMVTPNHASIVAPFLADLRECAAELAGTHPAPESAAAMYGMLGAVPGRDQVDAFILDFMDSLDAPGVR